MIVKSERTTYCVNRDWLSFSGQLILSRGEDIGDVELSVPDGYRLQILSQTNVFRKRAYLLNRQGVKMLTILWQPIARWLNRRLIQFQVANALLYSCDLDRMIDITLYLHNYSFLCISRLDLCVDFECTTRLRRIINAIYNRKMYVANKHNGNNWWNDDAQLVEPHDMNWGGKKSDFKWKLYNKSRELEVTSKKPKKPYIWEEWSAAGMNITNVWRLELSMTKVNAIKVYERFMDLDDVLSNAFMLEFFGTMYKSRFVVRRNGRHTRKSNDRVIEFIRYPFDGVIVKAKETIGVVKDNEVTTQIGHLTSMMESTQVLSSRLVFNHLAASLVMLIAKYNLGKYFVMSYGKSVASYIADLKSTFNAQVIGNNETLSMSTIGERVNSCWLRQKWIINQQKQKSYEMDN